MQHASTPINETIAKALGGDDQAQVVQVVAALELLAKLLSPQPLTRIRSEQGSAAGGQADENASGYSA
jgi:hypothetical protein